MSDRKPKPSSADEIIRDAMAAGKFENLPGAGKPLKLDDDAHVPQDWRLANKILKDNGYAPDWIMERRDLEVLRAALSAKLEREIRTQKQRAQGIDLESIRARYGEAVGRLNKKLLSHNLKLPPGVAHLAYFDVDREARRALEQSG